MQVWGLLLAAGGGTRFGAHKQFADLAGRSLLQHALDGLLPHCSGVVLLLPADRSWDRAAVAPWLTHLPEQVQLRAGGATRAESVRFGLAAVPVAADTVLVADAAHPLASDRLYGAVLAAVRAGADAALPGLALTEAVKQVDAQGQVGITTPAAGHVSAQLPMAFRAAALRQAHQRVGDAVEDSAMVQQDGGRVVIVPGEPTNVHVTTPAELAVAQALWPLVAVGADPARQT